MTAAAAPVSDADPFALAFMRDPYPEHAALRELGPVVRLSRYDCWAVARYEQVNAVLMDWAASGSAAGVGMSDLRKEKRLAVVRVDPVGARRAGTGPASLEFY